MANIPYDKNTDYQALINQALAAGAMGRAAIYERQRNQKIADGYGNGEKQTYLYQKGFPGSGAPLSNTGNVIGKNNVYAYDPNEDYQARIQECVAKGDMEGAAMAEKMRNAKIAGEAISNYKQTYNYSKPYSTEKVSLANPAYDPGTNYQEKINQCVADGDYEGAALAEWMRNSKIRNENLSYKETNTYSKYLPEDVLSAINAKKNSGSSTNDNTGDNEEPATADTAVAEPVKKTADTATAEPVKKTADNSNTAAFYQKALDQRSAEKKKQELIDAYSKALKPGWAQKNASAGQSAVSAQNFYEDAAASGLNSGAVKQQKAANSRVLQGYYDSADKNTVKALGQFTDAISNDGLDSYVDVDGAKVKDTDFMDQLNGGKIKGNYDYPTNKLKFTRNLSAY